MSGERRYSDEEVAEILEAAASGRALSSPGGLSLAELQAIGGEVGIAPEQIAHAAAALDVRRTAMPARRHLGMPVTVGRIVELPRAPTDQEWEMLVAELRQTFGARGKDRSSGGLRAWTNGNLHAYVEPTPTGHRLRLGTTKGNAATLNGVGLFAILAGLVMLALQLATGDALAPTGAADALIALFVALLGAGALGANALRLPGWAHEREQQMEYIAARAQALLRAET
ncbi:MAG TPA: hypothetical protein VFQ45_17110 [Longimicrobium sp.]|nr:hypothetical protein [Longimicrobium sp.]